MSVVVMGMHRSGTSAATGVLRFMGFALPEERYLLSAQPENPQGYFENRMLVDVNQRLLERLGGAWSAPPTLAHNWEQGDDLADLRDEAANSFEESMPDRNWLWKDPRTCITFPFWVPVMTNPWIILFIHRHPAAVARSLAARDGFPPSLGLALWERYTRDALANMHTYPVISSTYEDLVEDPMSWTHRVHDALRAAGAPVGHMNGREIKAFVHHSDRGSKREEERSINKLLSPSQNDLLNRVVELEDRYETFPSLDLPPQTDWAKALLEERRRYIEEERRRLRQGREARQRHLGLVERHDDLKERHRKLVRELQAMPSWWRKGGRAYARLRASLGRRGHGASDDGGA